MGIKRDYEYWEDVDGRILKVKKINTDVLPEFRDFPRGIVFKRIQHDFEDNFKDRVDYGNDKLLTGKKSKKTIKFKKGGFKRNPYNSSRSDLSKYI